MIGCVYTVYLTYINFARVRIADNLRSEADFFHSECQQNGIRSALG